MRLYARIRHIWDRIRYWWQRHTRGYSEEEVFNFEYHCARYCVPRLRRLRECACSYPMGLTVGEWDILVDEMIWALEYVVKEDDGIVEWSEEDDARASRGLELFGKWFQHLWD